jgi:hypothetical protein
MKPIIDSKKMAADMKSHLLRSFEILDQIESGEKDAVLFEIVQTNMEGTLNLMKLAGYGKKVGRPKSDSAMTSAERVRKHRAANQPD